MNKTIIININGMVFHIEEDAYEILKNYMTDVKRHFYNSQDSLEITTDIENRIAEMFNEILASGHKQVIIETDVAGVIEQMGTVEDFEQAEEEAPKAAPNTYSTNTGSRSLFRDSDDHLVAGVCAGLANFFDIKPIWVRLVFVAAIAFFGIGLIPYIILWLIVPKAKSRADRMAMRGEKLNLQGFKNNFEEELSEARHDAKPAVYKVRDFFSDLFFHSGRFFKTTGKILVKLLGIFILLSCLAGVIAFIILYAAAIVFNKDSIDLFPFNVIDNQYAGRLYTSAFITVVIPIIAIALLTVSAIFNVRSISKSSASIVLVAWLVALGAMIFYIARVGAGFRSSASFNQTLAIKPTLKNTYHLKLNDVKYLTSEDSTRLDIKTNFSNAIVTNDDDRDNEPRNVAIYIERSDVSQPVLVQSYSSKGGSYDDALANARNTHYTFVQQDTVLKFDRTLLRMNGANWHDQKIDLTLKIPLNTVLVIDEDLDRYIRDGVDVYACKNTNKKPDDRSASFIMTPTGLECKVDTLVIIPDSVKILNPKRKHAKVK